MNEASTIPLKNAKLNRSGNITVLARTVEKLEK